MSSACGFLGQAPEAGGHVGKRDAVWRRVSLPCRRPLYLVTFSDAAVERSERWWYNCDMTKKHLRGGGLVPSYRYHSPSVPQSAIRGFARQIADRFHPDKIMLFGSYAYGRPHEESDVDLLVIMPATDEVAQSIRITLALKRPFPLDVIVKTPKHVERGLREEDWFLREVMEKGKVLYEAPNRSLGAQGGKRYRRGKGSRRTKAAS